MKNCTQKNKYYKVALRFTFVTIAIIISSGLFRLMMEKDYFTDSMNKLICLLVVIGCYLIMSVIEYQYLLKHGNTKTSLIKAFLRNTIVVAIAIVILGIVMFCL